MMKHRLIYVAIGSATVFVLGGIFKEQVQTLFAPYADVSYAILIVLGIGVPFAAIALFRVSENPRLLDQLFDLHITKRKTKRRYDAKRFWTRQQNVTLPKKARAKSHLQKRKRDNANDYAYPPEAQQEIVEKYWEARKKGEVENRDAWASRYNISGRTLRTYEKAYLAERNGNKTRK